MDFFKQLASGILHFDTHLAWFVTQFHELTYFILAAIVFVENGVVFIPFLPGDSLLFVCGAFAAKGVLDVWVLVITLMIASVLGGMLNYSAGRWAANRFANRHIPFVNPAHIEKTNDYFSKYGALQRVCGVKS
jgi:membrane-associated protein